MPGILPVSWRASEWRSWNRQAEPLEALHNPAVTCSGRLTRFRKALAAGITPGEVCGQCGTAHGTRGHWTGIGTIARFPTLRTEDKRPGEIASQGTKNNR